MKRTGHKQTKDKQTRAFCQIRDGLLEAIELEKNCLADRAPIDILLSPAVMLGYMPRNEHRIIEPLR